jgi:hypothetical protein
MTAGILILGDCNKNGRKTGYNAGRTRGQKWLKWIMFT